MRISVVLPTYNESKHIIDALLSIATNTVQPYEVIVVDGGSEDGTVELVSAAFPEVTLLSNPQRHAAAARNIGVSAAKGDIIAFTDGDCIVDSHWIENIELAFTNQEIDGVSGKVLNAKPENRYEDYWGRLAWTLLMSFDDNMKLIPNRRQLNDTFVTANCAYKRDLLVSLGGFDSFFANNAEDTDLCWRALEFGAKLLYDPTIIIYAHNVTSLSGIAKKSFRNGVSSSKLQKRYGGKVNCDPEIYKMLGKNLIGLATRQKDAELNVVELLCHLAGKYYGSLKVKVINV